MIEFVLPTSSRTQSLDRMPRSAVTLLLGSAVNARVSPARLPMVQIGLPCLQAAHGDRARPPGRAEFYRESAGDSLSQSLLAEFEQSVNILLQHAGLGLPWPPCWPASLPDEALPVLASLPVSDG